MSFWSGLLTKVVESAAESGVVKEASSALLEGVARTVRRMAFESVTPAELGLALLAARLCELTYDTNTSEALSAGLASLLPQSELVWFQPQLEHHVTAQWYMARAQLPPGVDDGGPALFVVFRGTQSFNDVANNLQALPAAGPHGGEFHAGFLRATRDDATLGRLLREHVPRTPRVYLMGHSLGGALALTLWGAQLLPPAAGRVTVVTLGSPAVFHGAAQLTPAQQRARVLSVVNAADAVPRLLGSPMKLIKGVLGACVDTSGGKARDTARMLQTLEEYTQPPQLELLYLSERGGAQRVPPSERDAVLHLADGLSANTVRDHLAYMPVLEQLAGAAPARARAHHGARSAHHGARGARLGA